MKELDLNYTNKKLAEKVEKLNNQKVNLTDNIKRQLREFEDEMNFNYLKRRYNYWLSKEGSQIYYYKSWNTLTDDREVVFWSFKEKDEKFNETLYEDEFDFFEAFLKICEECQFFRRELNFVKIKFDEEKEKYVFKSVFFDKKYDDKAPQRR